MPNNKELLKKLGFFPKENESEIFYKKFHSLGDYIIEVDYHKTKFDFGTKIKSDSHTAQNFSQEESWVVLECVNRLLEKGYKPEDITLEKIYPTGHGTSGRLDILVKKDTKAYLMVECKTWGNEYQKALKKMQKDGGQLFTYFQQDRDTQYLMLYASAFNKGEINFESEIVKMEKHYREAGNVKDLYDRWNKLSKSNGIFDDWVNAYEFQNKALTINDLKIIKQEDSSFIFNRFLEILRQNVVSDKPNAFNKIFTLFLCKIVDEDRAKNEQLHFQYLEGDDDNISFQKRLTDLYKRGMHELLEKDVVDMGDEEFKKKFGAVDEKYKSEFLKILTEIRLKKNNEFAFKEVFDDHSFDENAKVVKQVVELLQEYQIRYNKKHQYLGDFFELLLTTGLKQESGQFFTPVPVAKYIINSLPIREIIQEKISKGNPNDLIPFTIDYAAGSGHFLIESMESIQKILASIDENKLNPQSAKKISGWKTNQFDWAFDYVYGIEKDYRLVKTAKVGCYLHGDGLAKVIHGDGLGTFDKTSEYRGKLKETDHDFPQDNKQFDLVISNPPYSVSAFRGNLDEENAKKSFDLFDRLTDQSSEIECLFIERTKQLLKDGGLAGIIFPSSILSNTGIYTKTREILFKYFEIIGITELGSGTFMATGTNTVILFLRKRNNYEWENIKSSVEKFFQNTNDVTVNGIENVFSKYVKYVWGGIKFEDYIGLCKNTISKNIKNHEIYREYEKKLKVKDQIDLQKVIIEKEKEKLLYFILAYTQKVILTKSGQKKEEKKFLGYEFSNRRGYEGIHPILRGKSIDECTKMYDPENQEDETKANSYIYKAFLGSMDQKIHKSLEKNVFEISLIETMTFDRVNFEKSINLNASKSVKFESKFENKILESLVTFQSGLWKGEKNELRTVKVLRNTNFKLNNGKLSYDDVAEIEVDANQLPDRKLQFGDIILEKSGGSDTQAIGRVVIFDKKDDEIYSYSNFCTRLRVNDVDMVNPFYIWIILNNFYNKGGTIPLQNGVRLLNIDMTGYKKIEIPLPPKDIQEKIVSEIEALEQREKEIFNQVVILESEIKACLSSSSKSLDIKIGDILTLEYGSPLTEKDRVNGEYPVMGSNGTIGFHNSFTVNGPAIIVGRKGSAGKVTWVEEDNNPIDTTFYVKKIDEETDYRFLYYMLCDIDLEKLVLGTGVPGLNRNNVYSQTYKLPSFEEQKRIVSQIIKIENQTIKLNKELQESGNQKNEVLKKYL
ncbi:restriction endonuclease subunit S [Candidatus Roizmanbacteria bacterium CG_4_9_14_0_2_um_filter_39_13]|uniref:site-specific DNA-methyltransferase (adenine-specific) n=1 Tax=Candidatus Roizmanbacteria bacterium CG_4_9_14_0_2_um_filter_39_13 TaxID=1974839 RepID=A0A2M8F449_9BACT|nr:MAG: restriction endonuclease subunit S [Candidatus Roizmanbacteria bacterium CG_4_10_14_0_2_um_filter_39_12]PJC34065.1 MAG: restriction endonuclease subunit S [Candidatus Roizmanbacteria bacterium CG_4_9_14_0_2_um_filter_39_13]